MAKRLLFLLVIPFALFAGELKLENGSIKAHTEVFGDSTIDPMTQKIVTNLKIENGVESITGEVKINAVDLISDNADRDSNMYEALEANNFSTMSFEISNISKNESAYVISGVLNLHGVSRDLDLEASIIEENGIITLKSDFSFNMSDYAIEPPTLLFLTVRDQVDITVNLNLKSE